MNEYVAVAGLVTGVTVAVKTYLSVFIKPTDPRYDVTVHAILFVLTVLLVLAVRGLPVSGSDAVTSITIAGAILSGGVGAHTLGQVGAAVITKTS